MKLGKHPATHDHRDLLLRDFVARELPALPRRFGYGNAVKDWGMLGNAELGDCVEAAGAHTVMLESESVHGTAGMVRFTDESVISDYSAVAGYDPTQTDRHGNNPTDQGTNMRDYLNYWRKTGILAADGTRHKIGAFLALEPGSYSDLMMAAWLGLAIEIGVEFPEAGFAEFDRGVPFETTTGSIAGGHAIVGTGRLAVDNNGVLTWAKRTGATQHWLESQCDEAYAIVSLDALRTDGKNARGLDVAALTEALGGLG